MEKRDKNKKCLRSEESSRESRKIGKEGSINRSRVGWKGD
jgi:hypothetical protein